MAYRFISRRRFIENSISSGLVAGLGLGVEAFLAGAAAAGSDGLTLEVSGNANQGYGVSLLFNGQPAVRHDRGSEFSAIFQNEDRSVEDRVDAWKATSWAGDATSLTLNGECKLKNLNVTVFVHVGYQRITPRIVRKTIRLRQADMFLLF